MSKYLNEIRKKYDYRYSSSEISLIYWLFKFKEYSNFDKFINIFEKSKVNIEDIKIYKSCVKVNTFLGELK